MINTNRRREQKESISAARAHRVDLCACRCGKKRATKFHKPIYFKTLALYSKSLLSKVIGWGSRIPHPSEVHVNQ